MTREVEHLQRIADAMEKVTEPMLVVRPSPEQIKEMEAAYLAASEDVARERARFAVEWQYIRISVNSDQAATQATIDATKDALTVALANQRIAEWRLNRG